MELVKVATLNNLKEEGKLVIPPSQESVMSDPNAAQRIVYSLRTTKKSSVIHMDGFEHIDGTNCFGRTPTKFAKLDDKLYPIGDVSELMTALRLYRGENIINGYVCEDSSMMSYIKRISKGKTGMSRKNLPASMQKKLNNLKLCVDVIQVNSLDDIVKIRNKWVTANNRQLNKVVVTNEYSLFFNMFSELAHTLKFNKGNADKHVPSYWDELPSNVQVAFFDIANKIKKTNFREKVIRNMLLLSINTANYANRKNIYNGDETYNFICSQHTGDSKAKCMDIVNNTLLNLSIATSLLDESKMQHPLLWVGCVYNFGFYSKTSYVRKKDRHETIKLNNKTINAKKERFNELLGMCLTGHKNMFEGTSFKISNAVGSDMPAPVFNSSTVDADLHSVSSLYITSEVIKSIYNEI